MRRVLLKSKLHRAVITEADRDYEGSLTIDGDLMDKAGILPYEQVDVYNIANGSRLTTYAIRGEEGSGVLCANGAAAHLCSPGDRVIVACYGLLEEKELEDFKPVILLMNDKNRIRRYM